MTSGAPDLWRAAPTRCPDGPGGAFIAAQPPAGRLPGNVSIESLIVRIRTHAPDANADLIRAAYILAEQAHREQKRDNGDPYIVHPLAVADILAGYGLDEASIATALLHDVIEDT